VPLSPNNII